MTLERNGTKWGEEGRKEEGKRNGYAVHLNWNRIEFLITQLPSPVHRILSNSSALFLHSLLHSNCLPIHLCAEIEMDWIDGLQLPR